MQSQLAKKIAELERGGTNPGWIVGCGIEEPAKPGGQSKALGKKTVCGIAQTRECENAQSRAIEFTLLLSLPCLVAFLIVPDLILRALFARGAFTTADAAAAGATLAAYALGLVPFVLIRSMVAMFFARGDTATPVKAALIAVPVNIAFKILLMGPLAQVGLAVATAIGAWINFALVLWFGVRAGYLRRDPNLARAIGKLAAASAALALVLWLGQGPALGAFAAWGGWRDLMGLILLAAIGGARDPLS